MFQQLVRDKSFAEEVEELRRHREAIAKRNGTPIKPRAEVAPAVTATARLGAVGEEGKRVEIQTPPPAQAKDVPASQPLASPKSLQSLPHASHGQPTAGLPVPHIQGQSKAELPVPHWQQVSGLSPEAELKFTEDERRAAMRKLKVAAEAEIRAELARAAADTANASERSFLWEPVPAACRRLGISRTGLSRYMKELTGMSASDMADRIRAESVKDKMRAELTKTFRDMWAPGRTGGKDLILKTVCEALKFERERVLFNRAQWANGFGFANYARMHRACLLCYGRTPQQIERGILLEILKEYNVAAAAERRELLKKEDPEGKLSESDRWKLQSMRTVMGLNDAECNSLRETLIAQAAAAAQAKKAAPAAK